MYAIPLSGGTWRKNCSNASRPPAEAPMPMMGNPAACFSPEFETREFPILRPSSIYLSFRLVWSPSSPRRTRLCGGATRRAIIFLFLTAMFFSTICCSSHCLPFGKDCYFKKEAFHHKAPLLLSQLPFM